MAYDLFQRGPRSPSDAVSGRLVTVLNGWAEERFQLGAYDASRRQLPGKVRAFLDFIALGLVSGASRAGVSGLSGLRGEIEFDGDAVRIGDEDLTDLEQGREALGERRAKPREPLAARGPVRREEGDMIQRA
jgi:hypothetical protein